MLRVKSGPDGPPLFGLAVAALTFATLGVRLWVGHDLPLWIDESWTAMIAGQSSWSAFWREVWLDCNPPLYYGLMALWTQLFGLSALALRLPSILLVTAAALMPLLWRVPGLPRSAAYVWAILILFWGPGLELSVDARGYGLLLFLSTAQVIAYVRLLDRPQGRRALLWASLASLCALTHYHALLLAGIGGIAGAQAGCNWQPTASAYVIGLEADADWTNLKNSKSINTKCSLHCWCKRERSSFVPYSTTLRI